jgi:hypothetical protein
LKIAVSKRHREPRELDLSHEVLARHERPHGRRCGLAEERVQHDAHEQRHREELEIAAELQEDLEDRE